MLRTLKKLVHYVLVDPAILIIYVLASFLCDLEYNVLKISKKLPDL